jgi:hypothetical protein
VPRTGVWIRSRVLVQAAGMCKAPREDSFKEGLHL